MSAVLPHYKSGPANYQAAGLIFGGQLVMPNSAVAGSSDLTVKVATTTALTVMGVAGTDANVVSTQVGAANAYGQPLIDLSVLTDYVAVYYGGIEIWCWYSAQTIEGQTVVINNNFGCLGPYTGSGDFSAVVGRCTHPGGVATAMLTQQIGGGAGGGGSASYFLARTRLF